MPATFRIHGPSPQPAERDPADDSFAAVIRNDSECRACGERLADLDHPLCELCRGAVRDEGDL
jgi:hypothetical protein